MPVGRQGRRPPPGVSALAASGLSWTFSRFQVLVWVLTFLSYTLYHASRKPLSIVRGVLHPVQTPSSNSTFHLQQPGWPPFEGPMGRTYLGTLDFAFLACYSVGMYFSGQLADRLNLRVFLAVGMLGSGFFCCLFGLGFFWGVHTFPFFLLTHALTGLLQSTGWPSVVAAMAHWHGKEGRGLILGVWNAHTSLGNILGSLGSSAVLFLGWGWGFLIPGIGIAVGGVLVFLLMPGEPEDVGMESPHSRDQDEDEEEGTSSPVKSSHVHGAERLASEEAADDLSKPLLPSEATAPGGSCHGEGQAPVHGGALSHGSADVGRGGSGREGGGRPGSGRESSSGGVSGRSSHEGPEGETEGSTAVLAHAVESRPEAVGFMEAWLIPGVAAYAFCLFFAKLVAYTFLNWLPFYISHTRIGGKFMSDALAGVTSIVFDIGGVAGGVLAGHLSDKYASQALVSTVFLIGAVPMLGVYYTFGHISVAVNVVLLAFVGFFVNAPYALITCAVSADLGQHDSLKGNSRALSTVTAIIDGTGSLGAGVGPFLTGVVADMLGGWAGVFGMLMLSTALAVVCIALLARAEWRSLSSHYFQDENTTGPA